MKASWRAIKIIAVGNQPLKNKWHCSGCDKLCTATLPLNEAPDRNCNGGYAPPKGR